MVRKPSFSVVLIAKNEAKTLPRLVKSLTDFQKRGGEIILVDTGSTDDTAKVARSLGCRVHEEGTRFIVRLDDLAVRGINYRFIEENEEDVVNVGDSLFDYAAARNYAASLSKTNMVAMPDCDEEFTKLNLDKIEEAIAAGIERFEYNFVFSHDEFGSEAIKFLHSKFYDKTKINWIGIVHEVLIGEAKTKFFDENDIKLEHWQNPSSNRAAYLPGLALDCYLHPEKDRNSHYFGRELGWSGRHKSAIKELKRHTTLPNGWPPEQAQSMIYIGDAYMALNKVDDGLYWYHNAFQKDGSRRESLLRLANYWYRKNEPQRTAAYCAAALTIPWNGFYANDMAQYRQHPHELMYWALWYMGDREGSKKHFDICYSYQPKNQKYIHDRQFYHPEEFEYQDQGIDGWMSAAELEWLYQTAKKSKSVLELGSWKGRSTHALLSGCKGTVTCVDTFKGSADPGDLTHNIQQDIYGEFIKNVGHFKNLEVLRMTGKQAAELCKDRKFDFVFIDAGHTYEEVKEDIECWKDKATVILAGHDYTYVWLGVQKAVDECLGKTSLHETIWCKPVDRIPKRIFTIWLSENSKVPSKIQKCINTQRNVEGYEHKLITLKNCPKGITYIEDAIKAKKWVKAADYIRMFELFNNGGIYCDADMEILPGKNFDDMLHWSLFAAREENNFIATSLIGAAKANPVIEGHICEVMERFRGDDDKIFESSMEIFTPRVYAAKATNDHDTHVYEPDYFFPYNHQTGIINVTENTIAFHHFMKSWINTTDLLPRVSILLPTLGRQEGLNRCLESIDQLYYPKHLLETIVDFTDEKVPSKVNRMLKRAKGDVIVFAANDMEFAPDSLYKAIKASAGQGLVAFNSGPLYPDKGNICEHFLIWKQTIKQIGGEIFSERFHHVGCDNLLWARCEKLGLAIRCNEAMVNHYHFSKSGQMMDEIYEKGWSHIEEDRKVLREELAKLEAA